MSTYRYIATSVLTGAVLADNIPLAVNKATRAINGVGQLDGYLQLSKANSVFLRALIPDQSLIWILQDGYPVWVGLIADSNHQSIGSHQYPITAYTPESILQSRLITSALTFTNADVFDIARALVAYAFSPARGPNAWLAGLTFSTGLSGVLDTVTFGVSNTLVAAGNTYTGVYSDNQPVADALNTEADATSFEYTFEPQLNGGALQILVRLGYPALGRYNSPAILLSHPGQVIDYARPVMRSQSANMLIGTSAANGSGTTYASQAPHGIDANDLAQGNILRQVAVSWPGSGVTSQAQLNQYTDSQLARYTAGTMVPSIVLGGGTQPSLTEIGLGDAIQFAATNDLDPPGPGGAPGLQITARAPGWSLQPPGPGGQEEKLTLNLGALVGSTGIGGVGIA